MSIPLRRIAAFITAVATAVLAFAGALYFAAGLVLIPHTVENGREIEKAFSAASSWVDSFNQIRGHLPSSEEFAAWTSSQPDNAFKDMRLLAKQPEFPSQVIKSFGQPAANSYVLETWRGEWFEYFASWAHASTVDGALSLYGSTVIITIAFFAAASASWHLHTKCRPTRRSSGPRA